jgi:hypothetical protein
MSTLRETIMSRPKRPLAKVEVPAAGGTLYVRRMSVEDRDGFDLSIKRDDDGKPLDREFRAKLIAYCAAADEAGTRLFTDADEAWLKGEDAADWEPLVDIALAENAFGKKAKDAAKKG